jgi:hypothetical protein
MTIYVPIRDVKSEPPRPLEYLMMIDWQEIAARFADMAKRSRK